MPLEETWVDADLQAARRALRRERLEVGRWRRLLRARLDLLVGAYAPPEILGTTGWDHLPAGRLTLPLPGEMAAAIWVDCGTEDRVALMRRLRDLDRRLGAYVAEIDTALDATTDEVLARMGPAATALAGLVEPAGALGGRSGVR